MNRTLLIAAVMLGLAACNQQQQPAPAPATKAPTPAPTVAADCCQCSSRGSGDGTPGNPYVPSAPLSCVTGTTNQAACDQACGTNVGGIMAGACKDGVHCQ